MKVALNAALCTTCRAGSREEKVAAAKVGVARTAGLPDARAWVVVHDPPVKLTPGEPPDVSSSVPAGKGTDTGA